MKAIRFLLLACALTLTVDAALARNDAQLEETIHEAVQLKRSPSVAWWRALGIEAPRVIRHLIEESRSRYYQIRLVTALGNYDQPEVGTYLKDLAQSTTFSALRRAAIRALGRSQGMREERFLARQLKSKNPHTRIAAAEALKETGHPKAELLVESYLKQERTPWVVAKLRR